MPRNSRLAAGKVPLAVLERSVFPFLGSPSKRVLIGAAVGEDTPIIDMGDRVLVVKANPITGAEKNIGKLAVNINANDVAARGAKPLWFLNIILLSEGTQEKELLKVMSEIDEACRRLNIQIIGGHTECTPNLKSPIIAGFMLGEAPKDKYITGKNVKPGDHILLTKGAGIEGTGIIASDFTNELKLKVSTRTLARAKKFIERISIVEEALKAVEAGGIHSMHTPTEGGIINGLAELGEAGSIGLRVEEKLIHLEPETRAICEALSIDPLKLISSGSLLLTVDPKRSENVINVLKEAGFEVTKIGEVLSNKNKRILIRKNGLIEKIKPVYQDELFRLLEARSVTFHK